LDELYPDAQCSLKYQTPFQLLIATQLSAQCTDARVNTVTPILFAKFPTAQEMSKATPDSLEKILYPLGFFRSKAKNLVTCSVTLMERYKGEVPASMDALLTLAGVGRKTANLILGDVFNMPAIVTDTHAIRLSNRMGLTKNTDPKKVENDLRKIVPPKSSSRFCHQLVLHGRAVCTARKPKCSECKLFAANLCNFNLVG
jgi:endonuclease-3